MNSEERMSIIRDRLQKKFFPSYLEVTDESYKHVGHEGAKGGAGHYRVVICAETFQNKTRIDSHREIYSVLEDFIPSQIHALIIKIK